MDSEQDAPGSWQTLMVAFKKKTHTHTNTVTELVSVSALISCSLGGCKQRHIV